MFVNIDYHLQFAMSIVIFLTLCTNSATKIRNKKENAKVFINFLKKNAKIIIYGKTIARFTTVSGVCVRHESRVPLLLLTRADLED